jgi:tetratricopeptide (TPR) repeat protein
MLVDLLVDMASGQVDGPPAMPVETALLRALNAVDWVVSTYPGTEHAEQAYLKKGDLVLRIKKQPKKALEIYKDGLVNARIHRSKFAERLGRAYLITEEYDLARKHFGQLVHSTTNEFQEAGVFYSGLLLGFTHEYETARDTLTALAEGNPSSAYTNDAIAFAWVIEEGLRGEQQVLNRYVSALKAEIAGDTTTVVEHLQAIVGLPTTTPLRARSLFKLGEAFHGMKEYDTAIGRYEEYLEDYPASPQLPDVKRRIAQVYERGYGKTQLALETYEDILVAHPHYIFLDEVRQDVTRLREHLGE